MPSAHPLGLVLLVVAAFGWGTNWPLLKVLLRIVSEQNNVAPKMVASSDDLDRIAADGENADVPAMHGWRREMFGERALKLIRGEMGLKFEKRRIRVFDLPAA